MPHEELNCRAASRLLSLAHERELTADEREALRHHLDLCFMCRNFESQLEVLHAAARRMASR